MKPYRLTLMLIASAAAASVLAVDTLRVDAQPVFNGPSADYRSMRVTLENDGPDAHGVLRVLGNGSSTRYPVDLPRGSRKRILTVNADADWGTIRLVLDTDRGTTIQYAPGNVADYQTGGAAVMIGGYEGDLAFLRQKDTEGKQVLMAHDLYVSPEDAPPRAACYSPFNTVVLGPGAEGLDDAVVAALKDYALGGGTLLFMGGERAGALSDRRWADVLPATAWQTRRVQASAALERLGGSPIAGAFTVVEPKQLAPGATSFTNEPGGPVFDTERGLGLGRVAVLGYSPLDEPLKRWDGRMRAFARFVRGGSSLSAHQYVEHYLNQGLNGYTHEIYGSSNLSSVQAVQTDPFNTKLPSAGTVFGLLAGYFVLVVPASFLVLRKMKRGELAWVTAPLLSLGFAGALFKSAEGLYAAKLSTASQGVVVLQEGQPRAMFYGTSQMFFPHGGNYDLKLRNVDQLTAVRRDDTYGTSALAGFDPVDDGREVTVPSLEANNLAFREMSYSQKVPGEWFRIDPVDADHVVVENRSPYAFNGWVVVDDRQGKARLRLRPGEKTTMEVDSERFVEQGQQSATDPHRFTKDGRVALVGHIDGFRPGPHVGDEIRNGIDVIAFAQEKMP